MTQSLPTDTRAFPPDWYDDPHAPGGRVKRYWDGAAWTEFVHDLGVDIAVPSPGPATDGATPAAPVDEHSGDPVAVEEPALRLVEPPPNVPKIGLFGARKAARQLAQENDALLLQMAQLSETVARHEAELAKMQAVLVDR